MLLDMHVSSMDHVVLYNKLLETNGRNSVVGGASPTSRHVSPITVTGRSGSARSLPLHPASSLQLV